MTTEITKRREIFNYLSRLVPTEWILCHISCAVTQSTFPSVGVLLWRVLWKQKMEKESYRPAFRCVIYCTHICVSFVCHLCVICVPSVCYPHLKHTSAASLAAPDTTLWWRIQMNLFISLFVACNILKDEHKTFLNQTWNGIQSPSSVNLK